MLGFPDLEQFPLEYDEFAKRYGKDYIESATHQITFATPEQIKEIEKLLSVVKTTEQEIEKVWTRAGVESWKELSTEQAAATIIWLKKKLQ